MHFWDHSQWDKMWFASKDLLKWCLSICQPILLQIVSNCSLSNLCSKKHVIIFPLPSVFIFSFKNKTFPFLIYFNLIPCSGCHQRLNLLFTSCINVIDILVIWPDRGSQSIPFSSSRKAGATTIISPASLKNIAGQFQKHVKVKAIYAVNEISSSCKMYQ